MPRPRKIVWIFRLEGQAASFMNAYDRHSKSGLTSMRWGALGPSLVLAGAFFASFASGDTSRQNPPHHEISVTMKLVQVYVTDKNGRPLTDLTRDEFLLSDNGKPVAITEFEMHEAVRESSAKPLDQASVQSPNRPMPANRKFVLFFDFAFNSAKGVGAGVRAALDFLKTKVNPQDEVALFSFSMMKGLRIHEFFTSEASKVSKAVSAITAKEISGRADEIERAYWILTENAAGSSGQASAELARMEMQRQDSTRQAQNYLLSLTSLARALRLVQGQKHILFFSSGVPSSLINVSGQVGTDAKISQPRGSGAGGAYSTAPSSGSMFQVGNSVLRSLQDTMMKEFSASNCMFFCFDTRESALLPSLFAYDEMAFAARVGGMFTADGVHQSSNKPFQDDKTTGMDTLKSLSKKSGGKYYSNIGLYGENLEDMVELTKTYYVLGYTIPSVEDGKHHEVRVAVTRKGSLVRAQRGYFNPKPFREYTRLEKDLHLIEIALNNSQGPAPPVHLPVQALAYDSGQGDRITVLARVPRTIRTEFGGESAEFVVLLFSEQDDLLSLQRSVISSSQYFGVDPILTAGAITKPGRVRCRAVLRDLKTGKSVVASTEVHAGRMGQSGIKVFTPLAFIRGSGATLIDGVVKDDPESVDWKRIYALDPATANPILSNEPISGKKFILAVPYTTGDRTGENFEFKLNLVDSETGENISIVGVPLEPIRAERHAVQHFEIQTSSIRPGRYFLYVHIGVGSSATSASAFVPLTFDTR